VQLGRESDVALGTVVLEATGGREHAIAGHRARVVAAPV
jgi:hypothetical protein